MNYIVENKNNPFMRKAKNCFHANTYDITCIQCQTYGQANQPEHADCFTPKIVEWNCSWIRFDEVQRMLPIW